MNVKTIAGECFGRLSRKGVPRGRQDLLRRLQNPGRNGEETNQQQRQKASFLFQLLTSSRHNSR